MLHAFRVRTKAGPSHPQRRPERPESLAHTVRHQAALETEPRSSVRSMRQRRAGAVDRTARTSANASGSSRSGVAMARFSFRSPRRAHMVRQRGAAARIALRALNGLGHTVSDSARERNAPPIPSRTDARRPPTHADAPAGREAAAVAPGDRLADKGMSVCLRDPRPSFRTDALGFSLRQLRPQSQPPHRGRRMSWARSCS
jgi:hypothetical protein